MKSVLCLYDDINEEKFQSLLSVLWTQRKRIITMKDVGVGEEWRKKDNAYIEMAKSAYGYLDYLSSDLQYLQSCLECINLNGKIINVKTKIVRDLIETHTREQEKRLLIASLKEIETARYIDYLPFVIDYRNTLDRFKFIRKMLRPIYIKDIIETANYIHNIKKYDRETKSMSEISNIASTPIVIKVANSVLNILNDRLKEASQPEKILIEDEHDAWESEITLVQLWNKLLFPKSDHNAYLKKLTGRY